VIERQGRSYLRRDLYSVEEFQRLLDDARPTDAPASAATIAAALRTHLFAGGVYYIEAEPNLELGEAVLRGERANTPAGIPREARTIIGTDNRVHSTTSQTYPLSTVAFQDSGCTATKVGRHTMITAAHCIYDNGIDDFMCVNGGSVAGGNCSGGYPNWRFGTEDGTGFGNFFGSNCGWWGVTSAFVALDGQVHTATKQWTMTRHDFGFVDLLAGGACTEYGTGWLGTWIASDTELSNMQGTLQGYPAWATCPAGISGGSAIDCGASKYRYNNDMTKPFSGAEIWGSSSNNVTAGPGVYAADTIQSDIDTTSGQSGSALFFSIVPGDRRVVGTYSIGVHASITPWNGYSRFTADKYNWLSASSQYPEDTQ